MLANFFVAFGAIGIKPVFVDPEVKSLNVDANNLIKKIKKKTKVILLVHVLGNGTDVKKIQTIAKKKKIILIEDMRESLGSEFKWKIFRNIWGFWNIFFYYSHQISLNRGGMVVCNSSEDYKILLSMRSHGWARNIKLDRKLKKKI